MNSLNYACALKTRATDAVEYVCGLMSACDKGVPSTRMGNYGGRHQTCAFRTIRRSLTVLNACGKHVIDGARFPIYSWGSPDEAKPKAKQNGLSCSDNKGGYEARNEVVTHTSTSIPLNTAGARGGRVDALLLRWATVVPLCDLKYNRVSALTTQLEEKVW